MDTQQFINVMIGVTGVLGGWWMKAIWEAIKDLEKADKRLSDQVGDLKFMVAGGYVKTEQFAGLSTAIFTKLDRIEDKLDGKVDKP